MKMRLYLIVIQICVAYLAYSQGPTKQSTSISKRLSGKENVENGQNFLEEGKRNLQNGYWYDGYYFYKALEHFANAYLMDYKKTEILAYIQEINSIGQSKSDNFKSFSETNLYKISSSFQKETKNKIDSLEKQIKLSEGGNVDKKILLEKYTELFELQKFHFREGKFQGFDFKQTRIIKANLEIEIGDYNLGCSEIYDADIQYFHNYGYASNTCKLWYDKYSAIENAKYKKEEENKATFWNKNHPNVIKLRSLLGENFTTIEAYLGSPIERNYKVDVGVGIHGQQYIGNKYKNKFGVYEIGFRNGNAIFIRFYPINYIKYSPDKFGSDNSGFDMESKLRGLCSGEYNNGNIGEIKIYSINLDCAESGLSSTVFYGLNGKLISVSAY